MTKKKTKKPRWTHLSLDGWCIARADECYGLRTIRIKGYPLRASRVRYLARWFAQAEKWLEEK